MQVIKNLTVIAKARKQYYCDGFEHLLSTRFSCSVDQLQAFNALDSRILKGEEYYYLKEKTSEGIKGIKVNKGVYQFLLELNLITFI